MEITLFHIWQKQYNRDPVWAKLNSKDDDTVVVYTPFLTTQDHDYAKHICSADDGRFVYTSQIGYFAAN